MRPDLFSFDQVQDIEIDVTETSREEKGTIDEKQVSYDPPHLVYMYVFTLRILLAHSYVKRASIILNREAVHIKNKGRRIWTNPGKRIVSWIADLPELIEENREAVYDDESLLQHVLRSKYEMPATAYGFRCTLENWNDIQRYRYYLAMAREIKQSILG